MAGETGEGTIIPRGGQTAESLREQPSATEPVVPIGGTVTSEGNFNPIQTQGGGPLPDTGRGVGAFFKKLNPFK